MTFKERFLLLTNEAAVGLFPEHKLNIILSPDATALAVICGEDRKRCLTRFCPTAVAPFVVRLLHFRNIHASTPFLCDRFFDASRYAQSSKVNREDAAALPTIFLCPLKRRLCLPTAADVYSSDPMTEIVHGRQLTSTVWTRVLPVELASAHSAGVQQGQDTGATSCEQSSREQFSLLLQELEPELSGLLALDQYPTSVLFAVKTEAVDDCTLVVSRVVGARTGCAEGTARAEGEAEGPGGGSGGPIVVEAWWPSPAQPGLPLPLPLPLPLGAVLSLAGDVFTHWSEQVVGEAPFVRCRAVDMHASLLDGLFAAPEAEAGADDGDATAWDEAVDVDVDSVAADDDSADAVTSLRKHRRVAVKLLQFREYLELRRRHLSWAVLVTPRGVAAAPQQVGGNYRLSLPDGQLELDEPDDRRRGGDRIVTLTLPTGTKFRAFPSTAGAGSGVGSGSGPLRYSSLRGVFADRTHVDVYLEADVSRGAPARTVRVLLPDASEFSFPLSAFADGETTAAAPSSSGGSSSGDRGVATAASLQPQVNALLSFHRWASAPPEQREALMCKMQAMARMVTQAGARSQRHLSVEKLRSSTGTSSGSGTGSGTGTGITSPRLSLQAVLRSTTPSDSSFPIQSLPRSLDACFAPSTTCRTAPAAPTPLWAPSSECGDRVREALRACQQTLQENAKILPT